ncbi:MG2 domain-containing protein [Saprospira grandis]|uniref:A-macroglobulin complement component n=1 Tax=Saprospira grandis (strain Lewin) TaxID=984262 RepID=H6LAD7_SAPGL|nr:MG2 domain-containing protein [Saprospira grandis]AFC24422.1 A-macroglobulin complement component [Saprospira grandis str. Lewin]
MHKIIYFLLFLGLYSSAWAQERPYSQKIEQYNEILPTENIYAQTDRSYYEPGETIWFSAYLLDQNLLASKSKVLEVEWLNPKGQVEKSYRLPVLKGKARGDFKLDKEAKGGIYTLRLKTNWQKNFGDQQFVFEKKLTVQNQYLPDLLMKLDFLRERYGAGDLMQAKLDVRTPQNEVLANKKLSYEIFLGGKVWKRGKGETNAMGQSQIQFELPAPLEASEGLLNVFVEHEGKRESIGRSIPLVQDKIQLHFMPESGDLMAGFKNRLAIKSLDLQGQAVDIEAVLLNAAGEELQAYKSYHQGMGALEFEPKAQEQYRLKVLRPVQQEFDLPKALRKGLSFKILSQDEEQLELEIYSSKKQSICLLMVQDAGLIEERGIALKAGSQRYSLPLKDCKMGIAKITLFNQAEQPEAERLFFAKKQAGLQIEIETDKDKYAIREKVNLKIKVKDAAGKPVQTQLSLAVVDDKFWNLDQDKADNILSHFLLSSQLKGKVQEPAFYFEDNNPKADTALDYLLLTQGWRRYNWRQIMAAEPQVKFMAEDGKRLAGQLFFNGAPLGNKSLGVYRNADKKLLAELKTDAEGFFVWEDYEGEDEILLKTKHRGFSLEQIGYNRKNYSHSLNRAPVYFQRQPFRAPQDKSAYYSRKKVGSSSDPAVLKGMVFDEYGEPFAFANVVLLKAGTEQLVKGTSTDFDGNYKLDGITPGIYDLKITYIGYPKGLIKQLRIGGGEQLRYDYYYSDSDLELMEMAIEEVQIVEYSIPLIEMDNTTAGQTLGAEDIEKLATRNIASIAATTAGVNQAENGEELSRGNRNNDIVIKGVRVIGGAPRPAPVEKIPAVGQETKLNTANLNENSNYLNLQRAEGQLRPSPTTDKLSQPQLSDTKTTIKGLSAKLSQEGWAKFYQSKSFYAADYSPYLAAKERYENISVERTDFRNTLYWNSSVETDEDGEAELYFYNSDAVTTFRIITEGAGGQKIGRQEKTYSVQAPFQLRAQLPKELIVGDTLRLPVFLINQTDEALSGKFYLSHSEQWQPLFSRDTQKYNIPKDSFLRLELPFVLNYSKSRDLNMKLSFFASGHKDALKLKSRLKARAFPVAISQADKQLQASYQLNIDEMKEGSMQAQITVFGNPLMQLQATLEGMIRRPYGCFEQVSSSTYPNILALHLLESTGQLDPQIADRALGYIQDGYNKLAGYESAGGGFEWFGGSPAHEGLTAYGLMEFKDMAAVAPIVDEAMVERARSWLLSRRDGRGGFLSAAGYNHGWGQSEAVSNAYITMSLAYIGEKGLDKELQLAAQEASASRDLYRLALVSLAHFYAGKKTKGKELLALLQKNMTDLNTLKAEHSITYATGRNLRPHILSLAILAHLEAGDLAACHPLVNALIKTKGRYYFGDTQGTVWSLKALTAYALAQKIQSAEDGKLLVHLNGELIQEQAFNSYEGLTLAMDNLAKKMALGQNQISLSFEGFSRAQSYMLELNWLEYTPPTAQDAPISVATRLAKTQALEGDLLRYEVEIKNELQDKDAPTPIAMIGIPAGLSLQSWQLKEQQEAGKFDYYEIFDNYLVLYFRKIPSGQSKKILLDLKAELPGHFTAPANSAYLYYRPNAVFWEAGQSIQIKVAN